MDMAKDLVKILELSVEDLRRQLRVTARDALSLGLTSLHDTGLTPTLVQFSENEEKLHLLPIRIYGMLFFNDTSGYWGRDRRPVIGTADGRFTMRSVKIVADGKFLVMQRFFFRN
jgi:predicted amidohydrolase YtcJ